MNADLSPSAVERIDEVCDRFEAAWKAGQEPRAEDYLATAAGPERDALLCELLQLDAHYRSRVKAPPTVGHQTTTPTGDAPLIAGYEMLGELGRGGMGVVYKARQLKPNRLVALKMISAGVHAGPRELERFLREADAVAHLQHPNIVQVYVVGEHHGHPYFALEYVAGGSLDQHLAGTPQAPRAAAQLVERLAHAIHHAHERGIIHRDLKPANILLSGREGRESRVEGRGPEGNSPPSFSGPRPSTLDSRLPKITDFGLAKLLDAGRGGTTQTGEVLGTPSYMAPEQVGAAGAISSATDVYGLGAILYELLTGRPPFRAETAVETLQQVQTIEPVSPSRLQPHCPRDLVTICVKCLSKQPVERYASALELAEDLLRFLEGKAIRARPVGPLRQALKWTRRQPVVAGLAALLLLAVVLGIGAGSWFWWRAEDGLAKAKDALGKQRAAQTEQMATLDRYQVALAHREWLANNVGRANDLLEECTVKQRDSWEWRYLDRMRRSTLATFSEHRNTVQTLAVHPLGRKIASAGHDSSVYVWNLDTQRGIRIGSHRLLALAVAYSPDQRMLASSGSHDGIIKLWDAESSAPLDEFPFEGKGEVAVWSLAFDPTSRYLAAGGPLQAKVWDTRERKWEYSMPTGRGDVLQVAFSPDGQRLATASFRVRVWDWENRAKTKKPLFDWDGHGIRTYDLAFSPDGTKLVSGGRDGLIRVRNLETPHDEFTLNAHQLNVTSVCFSPDGERLASAGQEGDMHIWHLKERRRLFTLHGHSGAVWDLVYADQGKRLVSAGSDFRVRVWDGAEGQEAITLPFQARDEIQALAFGPGGRLIAWSDLRGRVGVGDTVLRNEVLRLDSPGRDRTQAALFTFDPAGRHLAWRSSGVATLWDLETKAEVQLLGTEKGKVLGLAFSADGKQLLAAQAEIGKLHVRDLRTGQGVLTLPTSNDMVTRVVWSADAGRLVTVIEDRKSLQVWDAATGRILFQRENQPALNYLAFSHDGRILAAGGVGGRMRVWDVDGNRETMAVTGHPSNLYGLSLSPDGRRLASAASDCTAKLWDTQTGHEVLTLRTQLHEHSRLAFSPDGTDLASVTIDNQLQIWSTRSDARPAP